MSRARDIADFNASLFADDEISGDKVSGGTIGAGTFNGTIGSSATFPAGTVLQIVDAKLQDEFYFDPASSWDFGTQSTRSDKSHGSVIDNLSASLTTKGANSSFFLTLNLNQVVNGDADGGYGFGWRIYNSIDNYNVPVDTGTADGNKKQVTGGAWQAFSSSEFVTQDYASQVSHSSSLAKNSSLEYRVCISSHYASDNGGIIYIGKRLTQGNNIYDMKSVSTLRVYEVAT